MDLIGYSSEIQECSTKKKLSTTLQKLELYLKSYVFLKNMALLYFGPCPRCNTHYYLKMYGVGVFAIANAEFYSRVHFTMDVLVLSMKYNKKSFLIASKFQKPNSPSWNIALFTKTKIEGLWQKTSSNWKTCHWVVFQK